MNIVIYSVLIVFALFSIVYALCVLFKKDTNIEKPMVVTIPVYNEEKTLEMSIPEIIKQVNTIERQSTRRSLVVAVDLASTDRSYEILSHLEKKYPYFYVTTKESYWDFLKQLQ